MTYREQPNILVIVSDQHHPRMLGYRGHMHVRTPTLDGLAASGVSATQAYCNCPLCTPSRASFLTGKYVHQIDSWAIGVPLSPSEMTWPRRLTEAGFETAAYGKMDLCGDYQNPGFAEFQTFKERAAFEPYPLCTPWAPRLGGYVRPDKRRHIERSGAREDLSGPNGHAPGFYDHDRQVTDLGTEFIRGRARTSGDRPWVLYLGYLLPHWPYAIPREYFRMYHPNRVAWPHDAAFPNAKLHPALAHFQRAQDLTALPEEAFRRAIAAYYGMITALDALVGEVIAALRETNQYDNTFIVYTSDHGDSLGEHGLFYKECSYEGSVGVPLALAGPGIPSSAQIEVPVSLVDLYPTLMEMAGLETEVDRPGHSWLPLARGEKADRQDHVLAEFHGNFLPPSWYMLRRGDWKFTYYTNGLAPTLFNVKSDPLELCDLGSDEEYQEVKSNLEAMLRSILDPEAVAFRSKRDLGLVGPDGTDYTMTLTVEQLLEGQSTGRFPPGPERALRQQTRTA